MVSRTTGATQVSNARANDVGPHHHLRSLFRRRLRLGLLLWEKQNKIHSKLPLRVRQRLRMYGVVEVLDLHINGLIAHLENAADTTPKGHDPSFIRRQLPIRREDW